MFWAFEKRIFRFFASFFSFWVTKLKQFSGKVWRSIQSNGIAIWFQEASYKFVLKLSWAQKLMFWAFEKSIFQFFGNFWKAKLKPLSGKLRQRFQNYLNESLVKESFLEKCFQATLSSKANVVSVWKEHLQFFASFWVSKLKHFSGKVRQSVQKYLNQNLVTESFLEKCFEAILSSKMNVLNVWKEHFSVIYKCLSDENQTTLWESDGKRWKIFQSKSGHRKLPRKWFWSYLELKSECFDESMPLKRAFLRFLQIFEWKIWNHFLGQLGSASKTI